MTTFTEEWLVGVGGMQFYTRLYRPTSKLSGAIVFVHGYDEHISRYEQFHSAWAARGFAVFSYDLRGFGRTALDVLKSPNSVYGQMGQPLADIEWAVQHTRSLFAESIPLFLMGHSMGGGLVLDYVVSTSTARNADSVALLSGVVSSSPWLLLSNPLPILVFWIFAFMSWIFPNAHFSTPVRPKAISHDLSVGEKLIVDPWVRQYGTYGSLYGMLKMVPGMKLHKGGYKKWPKTLPLLLLHGTADDMNSCPASEHFIAGLTAEDKSLILYPDAFHDLMTEPKIKDKYEEDCISWVEAHAKSSSTLGGGGSRSAWKTQAADE